MIFIVHRIRNFQTNRKRLIFIEFSIEQDRKLKFKYKRLLKHSGIIIKEHLNNRLDIIKAVTDKFGLKNL